MLAIFLRRWWPFVLALAFLAGAAALYLVWLRRHDAAIRRDEQLLARDVVIAQRTDTAAARTAERRADSVTVKQTLALVRRDTLWRSDTVYVAGGTTPRYAVPIGTITRHDSAFAACDRLSSSCAREHLADSLVIVELRRSLALARTGSVTPPRRSRWSVGITAGLGAVASRDSAGAVRWRSGPSATAGISYRIH